MLRRKIAIDEALFSTSALAALEHLQVDAADQEKQKTVLEIDSDDLIAMNDLARKYRIPFDLKNVMATLGRISAHGMKHDELLVQYRLQRIKDMKAHGNQES